MTQTMLRYGTGLFCFALGFLSDGIVAVSLAAIAAFLVGPWGRWDD